MTKYVKLSPRGFANEFEIYRVETPQDEDVLAYMAEYFDGPNNDFGRDGGYVQTIDPKDKRFILNLADHPWAKVLEYNKASK